MATSDDPLLNKNNGTTALIRPLEIKQLIYDIVVPLLMLLCALSFLVNLYIVLLYRWIRRPMSSILRLTIGLAGADSWTSLILGTGFLLNSYLPMKHITIPRAFCVMLGLEALRLGGILTSILHLLLIALSHLLVIAYPRRGPVVMNRRVMNILLVIIWLLPPVSFLITFANIPYDGFQAGGCRLHFMGSFQFRIVIYILLMIPVLTMAAFYIVMIYLLHQADLQLAKRVTRGRPNRKKWRTLRTTALMLGSFLIGWLPSGTTFVLTSREIPFLSGMGFSVRVALSITVNVLMVLKFFLNPIIYSIRVPEIREALKRPILCMTPRPQDLYWRTGSFYSSFRSNTIQHFFSFRSRRSTIHEAVTPSTSLRSPRFGSSWNRRRSRRRYKKAPGTVHASDLSLAQSFNDTQDIEILL